MKLKPMIDYPDYWTPIQRRILEHMKNNVFLPVFRVIQDEHAMIENSLEDLVKAIQRGQIQYVKGHFQGRYDADTSRELKKLGAEYDRSEGYWKIPEAKLPVDIRMAIATSKSRFDRMSVRVQKQLDALLGDESLFTLSLDNLFDTSLWKMDKQFKENVRKVELVPTMSEGQRIHIVQSYTKNTELDVKKWSRQEIVKLRKLVQKNAFEGGLRREDLIEDIQEQFGVAERKARFLARQETNLLMASFQEKRYVDMGLPDYDWHCVVGSEQHPVRPAHEKLNGKQCSWKHPPLRANVSSNHRNDHPGQDYNCRCTAIPVVR